MELSTRTSESAAQELISSSKTPSNSVIRTGASSDTHSLSSLSTYPGRLLLIVLSFALKREWSVIESERDLFSAVAVHCLTGSVSVLLCLPAPHYASRDHIPSRPQYCLAGPKFQL